MMVLQNRKTIIKPLSVMTTEEKRQAIILNCREYNLEDGFPSVKDGYKPMKKQSTNIIGKPGRKLGSFTDENIKKYFTGSQLRLSNLLISIPVNQEVKFIGYNGNSCTVYKTVINGNINYHYRYSRMKQRKDLPIDYYYITIGKSERIFQSITCRNLVRYLTNIIKYQ